MKSIWYRIDKDGIRSYRRVNGTATVEGEPGKYFIYLPVPSSLIEFKEWVDKHGEVLKLGPVKKLNKARLKADKWIEHHYFEQLEKLAQQLKFKQENPTT